MAPTRSQCPPTMALAAAGTLAAAGLALAESYTLVGTTLNDMMRAPQSFCSSAAQNAGAFGNEFQGCLAENLVRLDREIGEEVRRCDEIFFDADLRLGCYRDHGVIERENREVLLNTMNAAIHDQPNCPAHLVEIEFARLTWEEQRQEAVALGVEPLPPWEEFWVAARPAMAQAYACELGDDGSDDKPWWKKICFVEILGLSGP